MNRFSKVLLVLSISAMSLAGSAALAHARPGGHWGGYPGAGGPCYGGQQQITPEMGQMMEKSYNAIAPLMMELQAKQDELTAKIYGGADEKTIKELTNELARLQGRAIEARAAMQKEFAKNGVPLHGAGCPGFMGGGYGGMGGMGGCMGGRQGFMHGGHGFMRGGMPYVAPEAADN